MNEERVQTRLQALEARIAAKENEIAETRLAIQAAESKEDSWLLKQQVTQLITQLTYLFEERKRILDLLYPPPPTVSAPAPPQQPVPSLEQIQQQYATLTQDGGVRLMRRELNGLVYSQLQPTSASQPATHAALPDHTAHTEQQDVPMRVYTATLTPPCMSLRWLLKKDVKFPVGMKTDIDASAEARGLENWVVKHTLLQLSGCDGPVEAVFLRAWGEVPALRMLNNSIPAFKGTKGPEITWESLELEETPLHIHLTNVELNSIGSGKGAEPNQPERSNKSKGKEKETDKKPSFGEAMRVASKLEGTLSALASPETSDIIGRAIASQIKELQMPQRFVDVSCSDIGVHVKFRIPNNKETVAVRHFVWDIQRELYRDVLTRDIAMDVVGVGGRKITDLSEPMSCVERVTVKSQESQADASSSVCP